MSAPYEEGRDARYRGFPRNANPNNKKSDSYVSWDNGWYDEDRDMRRAGDHPGRRNSPVEQGYV